MIIFGNLKARPDMRAEVLSQSAKIHFPERVLKKANEAIPAGKMKIEAFELKIDHISGKTVKANVFE